MSDNQNRSADVGRHMAKGAAWAILMRLAVRGLGVISTLILARLLAPEDYGMIAMATVLLGAVEGITAFGFDAVLVQDQDAGPDKYNTAWTMGVIRGVVLGAAFALAAPALADFYNEPRLVPLIQLLALGTFIEGFESVGIVDFRKQLRFDRDFTLQLIPRLISFVATLLLASALHNFWALAYGILIGRTSRVVTGFVMHPYRPRFTLARWREIFHFSKWLMVNSALRFVDNSGDTLVLGRYVPPAVLGFYTLAYEISNLALTELVAPIQRALLPGYARIAKDYATLRTTYMTTFSITVMLALPVAVGIAVTAPSSIPILLGETWLPCVPLVQILSISGALRLSVANSGAAYMAIGRPAYTTLLYAGTAAVSMPLLIFGAREAGPIGAALAMMVAGAVFASTNLLVLNKVIGIRLSDLARVILRSCAASLAMGSAVWLLQDHWPQSGGLVVLILRLAALCSFGALVLACVQIGLWLAASRPLGPERAMVDLLLRRFRSRQASRA
jgi:lipopolysaccharide exporter